MKKVFLCLFTLFIGYKSNGQIQEKYGQQVSADSLKSYLRVLTSDSLEGRETGQPGQKRAARYIASVFNRSNVTPKGDNGYFQTYPISIQWPTGTTIESKEKKYIFLKDYYFFPGFSDQKIETSEITFLGYGIDDSSYTDYHNVNVKDKVVVILDGEPVDKNGNSFITKRKDLSEWSTGWRKKAEKARSSGIRCLFIVVNDFNTSLNSNKHSIEKANMKLLVKGSGQDKTIPTFYISQEMAKTFLHKKPSSIKSKISKAHSSYSFSKSRELTIDINRQKEELSAENVLGLVEGTDLKDQYIVVTAHYDHLGKKDNIIYYGADDDGSGTSAVMELARVFAKAKAEGNGPRRSMLFMTVSGEEKGLLGSEYYTSNPIIPLSKTVADLNIDMIGRLDKKHEGNPNYIYIIGSDKLSTDLHKISEKANATYTKLELDYTFNQPNDPNRFYYRSDHYNFAKNNIPVIFYFNGVHDDYHKATDTFDKIDFKKMEHISRLVFYTAWELANRNERISVDVKNDFKPR